MNAVEIMALIDAVVALAQKLPAAVEVLRQNAELTAEEEAALDARIAGLKDLAHWKV